jgi:flavin-dependent dehydrogenase
LAETGRHVVILEASTMTRPKLCGGLLNRRAQNMIAGWAELPPQVRAYTDTPLLDFAPLEYHDIDNRIRARCDAGYRNIDRLAFDRWLLARATQAGAEPRLRSRVRSILMERDRIALQLPGDELTADWVVDASGAAAFSRRRLGGPAQSRLQAFQGEAHLDPPPDAMWAVFRRSYTPFYCWIIPKGNGRFLLGAGLTHADAKRWQAQAKHTGDPWAALSPLLDYLRRRQLEVVPLSGRPRAAALAWPLDTQGFWFGRGRVLAVGEAAGLVSPFSGEGISYALSSAEAAAFAIISGAGAEALPSLLARDLRKLQGALFRASVARTPWLRPWALWLAPLFKRLSLTYSPWGQGLNGK